MLYNLFLQIIKNKNNFLSSKEGSDFESRIRSTLKQKSTEIFSDELNKKDLALIKENITKSKNKSTFFPNFLGSDKKFVNSFIFQPFNKQEFPDFLLFYEKYIIGLELKYSKERQSLPIWNSNFPKLNSFYIFGSYGLQDITFFKGDSVIDLNLINDLLGFFDSLKEIEEKFNDEILKRENNFFGFSASIRKAYQNKKGINDQKNNLFKNIKRLEVESIALEKAKELI